MSATKQYDVIVIGAGHNGLVAASYLARAGKKVLVLERAGAAGGQLAGADFDGAAYEPLHAGARLLPDVARDLGLTESSSGPTRYVSLLPGGERLSLSLARGDTETFASIRKLSERDAARWPEFAAFLERAVSILDAAYRTPMPRLPQIGFDAGWPLAKLAWKLRRLGGRDMFRVIRSLSMSTLELTEEWFESDALRAAIAAVGVHGSTLGAMSAGTGFTLIHNVLVRGGLAQPAGSGAALARALADVVTKAGGELRTGCGAARILVERQVARGVALGDGSEVHAPVVVSTADPRRTLLDLVGAVELPTEFVWHAGSIKMRGSVAKVHLSTDGSHGLDAGTTYAVAPSIRHLERAYDAAKYGELAAQPYVEATTNGKVVSLHVQSAPYKLRGTDWGAARAVVEARAIDALAAHAPALRKSIKSVRSICAPDLERDYALTEGDLNHGQLILDQIFFMRPLPGFSDHRTPVDGLYLGGSGVHGGGGISGAAGRNAARAVLAKR